MMQFLIGKIGEQPFTDGFRCGVQDPAGKLQVTGCHDAEQIFNHLLVMIAMVFHRYAKSSEHPEIKSDWA